MIKSLFRLFVLFPFLAFAATAAAVERIATWNLTSNWAEAVTYPVVGSYRDIVGDELVPRSPLNAVGDPDLPFLRVNVDLPAGGTFVSVSAVAEWESVDLGGAWPLPIVQPVPTDSAPVIPAPGAAYAGVFPKDIAVAQPLQILYGKKIVPVNVTPFRWDGATKTLYRATSLKVEAKFEVEQKKALRMKLASAPSVRGTPVKGDDTTADYVVISPPAFTNLWKRYVDFRKKTDVGADHEFAVKSTSDIYRDYEDVGGDDAFKIHRYIEDLYKIGRIKYILLGSAPKKYAYDPECIVPSRYIVVGSSLGQLSDEYYGCMDRTPLDASGNEKGVEVWDYDGDGTYMGRKNANGTYACDSPDKIDWTQEIVVFRFPLMKEVVETRGNERIVLTAEQIMDRFIEKTKRVEGSDFSGRFSYAMLGSAAFSSSSYSKASRPEHQNSVVDERQFFDGLLNMFDPEHPRSSSDSEFEPRDRNWEFYTYLRGSCDENNVFRNSSFSRNTYGEIYTSSGDIYNIVAHGWARGADPGSATEAFFSTGCYTVYCNPVPCDTGMMDYCPAGSYGITNCICFGEAPVLAPNGGALASFNNTRLGWSAACATSGNQGKGQHSHRMDWLILRALSGVHSKLGTEGEAGDGSGEPMDAGRALMFAKNHFKDNYANAAWGLSGLEVTGQGDPLARISRQYPRVWRPDAPNGNWNRTDKNFTIPGKNDTYAADYSTDIFANLTGQADHTFTIQTNLSSAGLYVKQPVGSTLTIAGDAKYRVTRETVVTNGNLRWSAAGGAGRSGIRFVGARGNLTLPGDRPRYFGEKFANVGDIRVTGGNVTIDTPRNAQYGTGKAVDFQSLAFIGESPLGNGDSPCTNNCFRTRTANFLPEDFTIPVVNSELILQVSDNPRIAATNAIVKVQMNPQYEDCAFVRPIFLDNATLVGDYVNFALGAKTGGGFDLYVKGACRLAGAVPVRLNGQLRIHFADASSSLELANTLTDGTVAGGLTPLGDGKIIISAPQTFSGTVTVGGGQTLECTVSEAVASSIAVGEGGSIRLGTLPLTGLSSLTVNAGGELHLPKPTYTGTYKLVDAAVTTLTVSPQATVFDENEAEISGAVTQGHYVLASNQLVWQASGGVWDLNADNTTAWKTAQGAASAYTDNSPLRFGDTGDAVVDVQVGANVAPGFVEFANANGCYRFTSLAGVSPTVTFNSLIIPTHMTFDVPLVVPGGVMATFGSAQFRDVTTPKVEVADGGFLRATGRVDIASQRVKRLKFVFSGTRTAGERAAISELRLYQGNSRFMLPAGTIIRDIAGDAITVGEGTAGDAGQVVTGSVGDERLSALVDGNLGGGNKWWASKSASPTWFEITFPTPVERVTGYSLRTADQEKRDPKDWQVYASPDDVTRYSLVAEVSGKLHNARRDWINAEPNASPRDRFAVGTMSGLALVRGGGHLVLDGTWCADLELDADAVLAVTNRCCLTAANACNGLYLPESGTVKIDLSLSDRSSEAFPILRGYGITAAEFARFACVNDTAMLLLKDGDIYAATDNVAVPPYAATVSGTQNWSEISFRDKNNTPFTWKNANVKADGAVTLTVSTAATVTMDAVGTVASLKVTGGGALTVNAVSGVTPLAPAVLDDSNHTGALVWNLPIGSTDVKAGADTTIGGGAVGTGRLTVDANKKVTLGAGVTFANRTIDPAGWVRFAGTREGLVLADWPAAAYSFENATLAGRFTLDAHTIRSRAGDSVRLVGTNDNYNARSLLNFDIAGGLVEIAPNGESTWFGRTGTTGGKPATTFKMTGGTFRCLANGTGTGGGLLVGYEGGDAAGNEITLEISGGTFEVPDSFLNFGTPTVVNLTGTGVLKAKGYAASIASGTINLGTGNNDTSRLEVGSLGFQPGAASLTQRRNTAIVGFESGSCLCEGVVLYGSGRSVTTDTMTVAATNGASLTLKGMSFGFFTDSEGNVYNDKVPVTFGDAAKGLAGEVVLGDEAAFPKRWRVAAGTVNVGKTRALVASSLVERPSDGRVVSVVTRDEFASGASVEILYCDAWANGLSSEALRAFVTVRVEQEDGRLAEDTTGTLRCANGVIEFVPAGAAGYLFPVSASVSADADWTQLAWFDRNGVRYTNDWTGVISAELVCESGSHAVTMDREISMRRLTTRVSGGAALTLNAGANARLTLTDRLDDSASAGTTQLQIALGAGMTVSAGKALMIEGAKDLTTVHGKLIIGANSQVTVVDGYWNGEVVMADSTARLDYRSAVGLTSVPSSVNATSVGTVRYSAPITPAGGVAEFGSSSARAADGTFEFLDGGRFEADAFVTGLGNGTIQTLHLRKGEVNVGDSIVLSRDAGSRTAFYQDAGTLNAANATMVLGRQGKAIFTLKGGTCRLGGITTDGKDLGSALTLVTTPLEIGAGGIDIVSSIHAENVQYYPITTMMASIGSSCGTTISVPGGIGVYASIAFTPAAGSVMSLRAPLERYWMTKSQQMTACALQINGAGRVDLYERSDLSGGVDSRSGDTTVSAGTLRLTRRGLLDASRVVFGGGRMEVLLPQAEAVVASPYELFLSKAAVNTISANTKILIAETGGEVSGTFAKNGDSVVFTPSTATGITAAIAADTTGTWPSLPWKYSNGDSVPPGVWNTVVGTATLSNSAEARLSFDQICTVSSLALDNSGVLSVTGSGTMTVSTLDDSTSTGTTRLGSCIVAGTVAAGRNTIVERLGTGALTIGAGQQATVGSFDSGASISGDGMVSFALADRDTPLVWGANQTSPVKGTNELACGTWTHKSTSTYPRDREVVVCGTNAVLRFTTSTDISGYDGSTKALTIADGATWLVDMRDTFTRPLRLVNGGRLRLNMDNNSGGRAFDFFSKNNKPASLTVSGVEPCVIGGQNADLASLVNSGIVAIRLNNFSVDVKPEATLKVYSQWGCASEGAGNAWIKNGAGTMELYRTGGQTGKVTVNAGCLRLFDAGMATSGAIENNGVVEIVTSANFVKSFPNAVTGTGAFVKSGAGVLDYGTARPQYAIDVREGTLRFLLTDDEKAGGAWIALYKVDDSSDATGTSRPRSETFELMDVDGETPATISETRVSEGWVQVKVEVYRMPITLTVNESVTKDWTAADWRDANKTHIPSAAWTGLLQKTNLEIRVVANEDVILNVNTNVSAKILTVEGDGAVAFNSVDGHVLTAETVVPAGTFLVTGAIPAVSPLREGAVPADWRVRIAAGATFTNTLLTVAGSVSVTHLSTVRPFDGVVTFALAATLDIVSDGYVSSVPLTSGTLSIDPASTVRLNGTVRPAGTWNVTDGTVNFPLVGPFSATLAGAGSWTTLGWTDSSSVPVAVPSEYWASAKATDVAKLTVGADSTLTGSSAFGSGRLQVKGPGVLTLADACSVPVEIDASDVNGWTIASNAVRGAAYSRWLVRGNLTGGVTVVNAPTLPKGYLLETNVVDGIGVRFVVTAPSEAMLGAVSVNLYKDAPMAKGTVLSGLHPVPRTDWTNLQAAANQSVTISNMTFTTGPTASGYYINTCSDEIYRQYFDDGEGSTRTISISGIDYPAYRLIVYYSTDTANYPFQPLNVNGTWYAGPTAGTAAGYTVKGRQSFWGHSGPDKNMNAPAEGVNALVTDVMSDETVTLTFARPSATKNARATPAAIQVVRVGGVVRAAEPETFDEGVIGAWDGFENLNSKTNPPTFAYVANLNGSLLNDDGSVTIGNKPLSITGGQWWNNRDSGKAIVVAMLVSDYSYETAPKAQLAGFWANGKGDDYIGWLAAANPADKSYLYYNYSSERPTYNSATTPVPSDGGRYWYFVEYNNSGTYVFGTKAGEQSLVTYVSDTACKDGNRPGQAVNIGGKTSGACVATGMKVYAVRILSAAMDNAKRLALAANNTRYQDLGLSRATDVAMRGTPVLWVKATAEERAAGELTVSLPNFNGPLEDAVVHVTTEDGAKLATLGVSVDDATHTVTAAISATEPAHFTAMAASGTFVGQDWSEPFVSGAYNSATLTNAGDVAISFSDETTLESLSVVGSGTMELSLATGVAAPVLAVYDLREMSGTVRFAFDPGVNSRVMVDPEAKAAFAVKPTCAVVNDGWVRYDFAYAGAPKTRHEYAGPGNALSLYGEALSGVEYVFGGSGTFTGGARDAELAGGSTVTWAGDYAASGNTYLGMTDGTLNIASGACVTVPHVRLLNSGATANRVTLNVDGTLVVSSTSGDANVWNERGSYKGILFGHWHGQGTYNVNAGGALLATNAYLQLVYTAEAQTLNVKGGTLTVRGIQANAANKATVNLTDGGTIELAEGYLGQATAQNYGRGTVRAFARNTTSLPLAQAMTLTDATDGTTFDPNGLEIAISGAVCGAGKLVVNDSATTPGRVVLAGTRTYAGGTVVSRGTLRYPVGTMTGDIALEIGGTIDLRSDVSNDVYAVTVGLLTLGPGASIENVTLNGESLGDGWKFNAATNGIERIRVIEVDPSKTGGIIPAASTNAVKIVTVWTNGTEETALDLTSAFTLTKVEGGVTAELNPKASVTVGEGPTAETIAVTPELTESGDEHVEPLVVSESVAVGVKTIPGLTYKLMRGSDPSLFEHEADSERATSTRLQLEDADKPADKAFYRIQVVR